MIRHIVIQAFVITQICQSSSIVGLRDHLINSPKDFDNSDIYETYIKGSMVSYLNINELEELLVAIQVEFPEIVYTMEIGRTYQGNPLNAYVLLDSPTLLTIG